MSCMGVSEIFKFYSTDVLVSGSIYNMYKFEVNFTMDYYNVNYCFYGMVFGRENNEP